MKECKIGEIFEYNGEWYQCVKDTKCYECTFAKKHCNENPLFEAIGSCSKYYRKDATSVIFKKLEKVGLPYYNSDNKLCQEYKCYIVPLITDDIVYVLADNRVVIEVKQNKKEDMEEKKIKLSQDDIDWLKKQIRWAALPGYITHEEDYDRATEEIMNLFIPSDTEHSSSEKIGKNLKPFDLEAAKAGKPVCTRDGRNARIICFDRNDIKPIVALVTIVNGTSVIEKAFYYFEDGHHLSKNDNNIYDLMMLSEKKEGWINIYNADTTFYYVDGRVFETKDEAVKEAKEEVEKEQREKNEYIDTIRVEWEE